MKGCRPAYGVPEVLLGRHEQRGEYQEGDSHLGFSKYFKKMYHHKNRYLYRKIFQHTPCMYCIIILGRIFVKKKHDGYLEVVLNTYIYHLYKVVQYLQVYKRL